MQVFTRSVTGVVLLSSNDEAECEMFAWKARHVPAMSLDPARRTSCARGQKFVRRHEERCHALRGPESEGYMEGHTAVASSPWRACAMQGSQCTTCLLQDAEYVSPVATIVHADAPAQQMAVLLQNELHQNACADGAGGARVPPSGPRMVAAGAVAAGGAVLGRVAGAAATGTAGVETPHTGCALAHGLSATASASVSLPYSVLLAQCCWLDKGI